MKTQNQAPLRAHISSFLAICVFTSIAAAAQSTEAYIDHLIGALLGDTPLIEDLRQLTDEIGGRPEGTDANHRSVQWAVEKFRQAGVPVRKEPFVIKKGWLERDARAEVRGDVRFSVSVAAMPYSAPTPESGLVAPLRDGGRGTEEDFTRLGEAARAAVVLVEMPLLVDIARLVKEYQEASAIERRAEAAKVAGLVYVSSRTPGQLCRRIVARAGDNELPMLIVERDAGMRLLRLLRSGRKLELCVQLDLKIEKPLTSHNVVAEIQGREKPDEIVVIGAHLDSWELGQGALDNGCNVAMLIDIARQIKRLQMQPRRTIRFCIFNGEELGYHGSWAYTIAHAEELDHHVLAQSYDCGSGRIAGFLTNGRLALGQALERALAPVRGLGPFENLNTPVVGTDNFDFMLQGVANLVANQESANYGPNYHANSDTFDKVDQRQLRLNAVIAAAVTWSFAEMTVDWKRHTRADVQRLVDTSDLGEQMRSSWLLESWEKGERGLPK